MNGPVANLNWVAKVGQNVIIRIVFFFFAITTQTCWKEMKPLEAKGVATSNGLHKISNISLLIHPINTPISKIILLKKFFKISEDKKYT